MREDKFSIIIPAHNNSASLKTLLTELVYQKNTYYPETEIIVVENGSTEDMSFLSNYEDITVLHEKILGASHARNVGLDTSSGKYIGFIDSDDMIYPNYLHTIYTNMRDGLDWCSIGFSIDWRKTVPNIDINNPIAKSWSVWAYVYTYDIIGEKRFNEELNVGEDIEWIPHIIKPEYKGRIVKENIYNYTWENNNGSLSHLFNSGKLTKKKE